MCLIVERLNPTHTLTDADLRDYYDHNPDGWGLVTTDGAPEVYRGMTLDGLKKTLGRIGTRPFYLHLRMATHGRVDKSMTHPFDVFGNRKLWLIHNGVVNCRPTDKNKSDTWEMARLLSTMLDPKDFSRTIRSEGFRTMMEAFLGNNNRLVLIDEHGAVTFNDDLWHTMDGGHLAGMRVSNTYAWSCYKSKSADGFQSWLSRSYGIQEKALPYSDEDPRLDDPFYEGGEPDGVYKDPASMTRDELYEACWTNPDWAADEIAYIYGNV